MKELRDLQYFAGAACATSLPAVGYRGTSLIGNSAPLVPYGRTTPRALWSS